MNALVISNMDTKRAAVINARTGNSFFAGAKSMLIAQAKKQMKTGICHFAYLKRNGEYREAYGCLNPQLVAEHTNGYGESREKFYTTAYFDIEKGAWRSFRWESIVAVLS